MTKKREAKILKDPPPATLHYIKPSTNLAPKEVRGSQPWVRRQRDLNEAQPRIVVSEGTYDGAELRPYEGRPGAMDFKKCPSRGLG